jgi:hypothetical protein
MIPESKNSRMEFDIAHEVAMWMSMRRKKRDPKQLRQWDKGWENYLDDYRDDYGQAGVDLANKFRRELEGMSDLDAKAWHNRHLQKARKEGVKQDSDMTEQRKLAGVVFARPSLEEARNLYGGLLRLNEDKGEGWSAKEFCERLEKKVRPKIGGKYLRCSHFNRFNRKHDTIHVTFINLPEGDTSGARAMNNRAIFEVSGFGPGEDDPSPKGKVKFSVTVWSFRDLKKPRGATGSPAAILAKLAKALEGISDLGEE